MKAGEKYRQPRKRRTDRLVPLPVLVTEATCPACGDEVDLLTGDEETRCRGCDLEIYRKQRADH